MTQKIRTFSRKGKCPACSVSTGSRHNKKCVYAYKCEEDSKAKQKGVKDVLNVLFGKEDISEFEDYVIYNIGKQDYE